MNFVFPIECAVRACCEKYGDVCFVLEGNSLYTSVIKNMSHGSECISICDRMIYGKVSRNAYSYNFIRNRIKANLFMDFKEEYNGANIVNDIVSLQKLKAAKGKKYILIQWGTPIDDIWRIFVQGLLGKNKMTNEIVLLKICDDGCIIKSEFESLNISGAYDAFKNVVCRRKKTTPNNYGISEETMDFLIDINSKDSKILKYIRENIIDENDLAASYLKFCADDKINKFGLSEFDFYKLMYDKMIKDGEENLAKKFAKTY